MWLTVEHVTRFSYDASINEAYSEIRLKPAHRDGQRCSSFALATEPRGVSVAEYRDRFGNVVHHFDVLESHQNLGVTARSEVWTPEAFVDDEAAPSLLDRWDLLRESRYVPLEGSVAELAATVDVRRAVARDRARADDSRPGPDEVRDGLDARANAGRRGALGRPRRLPGLRARADRRLPAARDPGAVRQRLPLRPDAPAGTGTRPRTRGSTSGSPSAAGSRSTRPTTASRPTATCASASAATTPTSLPPAASTRARRRRSSRSPCGSASS